MGERKGTQWEHLMDPKIANSCSLESMVGQVRATAETGGGVAVSKNE